MTRLAAVLASSLLLGACGAGQKDAEPPPQAGVTPGTDFSTCAWPSESQPDTMKATVRLRVLVGPDGKPRGVEVKSAEPDSQGFGERAEQCALAMTFEPGVLPNGSPTQAWTPVLRVEFAR